MPKIKKPKTFNGKPLSHWKHEARRIVIGQLIHAAQLDTRSLPAKLASDRLLELARLEDQKMFNEAMGQEYLIKAFADKILK